MHIRCLLWHYSLSTSCIAATIAGAKETQSIKPIITIIAKTDVAHLSCKMGPDLSMEENGIMSYEAAAGAIAKLRVSASK